MLPREGLRVSFRVIQLVTIPRKLLGNGATYKLILPENAFVCGVEYSLRMFYHNFLIEHTDRREIRHLATKCILRSLVSVSVSVDIIPMIITLANNALLAHHASAAAQGGLSAKSISDICLIFLK